MPRNVSGTYTLPLPPVVPNTTIESDWANETLADISQALTDSLDRTGRGGLTAPFRLVDGTAAQPGLSFNAETGTGLYRAAPGQMGVTVMGTAVGGWTVEGFSGVVQQIDGDPTFTGIPVFDEGVTANGMVLAPGFRAVLGTGAAPSYEWWNTVAPTDKQRYVAYASAAGDWTFQSMNDTGTVADHWFSLRRPPTGDAGAGLPGWFIGGAGNSLMTLEGSSGVVVFGIDATASSIPRAIQFRTNTKPRWNIEVAGAEGGSNTGGDFGIARATDTGAYIGPAFRIYRSSGLAQFNAGRLQINGSADTGAIPGTQLFLNALAEGNTCSIYGTKAGSARWEITPGDGASNFIINRFDNAGGYLGTPFSINRITGAASFGNSLDVNGPTTVNGNITSNFGIFATGQVSAGSAEIGPNGGFPFIDFHVQSSGDFDARIICSGLPTTMEFTANYARFVTPAGLELSSGSIYVQNGGASLRGAQGAYVTLALEGGTFKKFVRVNGSSNGFDVVNAANTAECFSCSDSGRFIARAGYVSKAGSGPGIDYSPNLWNYQWDGNVAIWIDTTRIGWINVSTSDERIKHDIEPMGLLDEAVFAKIAPIKFRWRNIGPFIDDGLDHWGFSAQNLLDYAPRAVKGSVTEVGPDGEIYPANVDLMAILGQTILQLQNLQARCTAAGI